MAESDEKQNSNFQICHTPHNVIEWSDKKKHTVEIGENLVFCELTKMFLLYIVGRDFAFSSNKQYIHCSVLDRL